MIGHILSVVVLVIAIVFFSIISAIRSPIRPPRIVTNSIMFVLGIEEIKQEQKTELFAQEKKLTHAYARQLRAARERGINGSPFSNGVSQLDPNCAWNEGIIQCLP
jgi:hypothetical protein